MLSRFRPSPAFGVAWLALVIALGGSAYAVTGGFVGSGGQIHGCVSRTGSLVLVKQGHRCRRGTSAIVWIQSAPTHVQSADTATSAAHAQSADTATNAAFAQSAGGATNAQQLGGKGPGSYASVGSDPFTAATLNDGIAGGSIGSACYWTNYGAGQNDAGYFRDAFGIVHLQGFVTAHDGTTEFCIAAAGALIFQLPAGYAPEKQWAVATVSNDNPGRININPTGDVQIQPNFPSWPNAQQWVSLDGITFRCGPAGQNGCP